MNTLLYCIRSRTGFIACSITFLVVIVAYFAVVFYSQKHSVSTEDTVPEKDHSFNERSVAVSQDSPEFPYPGWSMECYPETIMPGDTIYYVITAQNPHEKSIYILDDYWCTGAELQTRLKDSEGQEQPLLFESPTSREWDRTAYPAEIKPGDSRIIGALAINIPPLEDIKEPFWDKHLKTLPADGEKFLLCVTVWSEPHTDDRDIDHELLLVMLELPITIKQRPEKEMAMIENWYCKTPKMLFPVPPPGLNERNQRKVPQEFMLPESKNIRVQRGYFYKEKYSQWNFVRLGNRYPSDPNAPSTWQGWEKLENSLTPSTMRDEIRLTRILIQYCNTKDTKVLTELKEWFEGMNVIQRTVMAKRIRDHAAGCYGNDALLLQYRNIYRAIRKYDTAGKSEYMLKYLKDTGLIE